MNSMKIDRQLKISNLKIPESILPASGYKLNPVNYELMGHKCSRYLKYQKIKLDGGTSEMGVSRVLLKVSKDRGINNVAMFSPICVYDRASTARDIVDTIDGR